MEDFLWTMMMVAMCSITFVVFTRMLIRNIRSARRWKRETAVISGYNKRYDPPYGTIYAPILEYMDREGNKKTIEHNFYKPDKNKLGKRTDILINPEMPFEIEVRSNFELFVFPSAFIAASVASLVLFIAVVYF